jgi:hypothetical protein
MSIAEEQRTSELVEAQVKAEALFNEVEGRALMRPGITEGRLNADIYALAKEMYGITTYWHKRIVRAGKNTLLPYAENPPDLMLGEDEIVFLDLGECLNRGRRISVEPLSSVATRSSKGCGKTSLTRLPRVSATSTLRPTSPAGNSSASRSRLRRNRGGSSAVPSQDIWTPREWESGWRGRRIPS